MGELYDKDGYKWYRQDAEVNPNVDIIDTGTGEQEVWRLFDFIIPPEQWTLTPEECYKMNEVFIKDSLWQDGLTTDDNYNPGYKILKNDLQYIIKIIVIAKPNKKREFTYEGVKEGQGGFAKKGRSGMKRTFHKTDNINTLLQYGAQRKPKAN